VINRLRKFFSAPFQLLLVISFSLIAATSIAIGAWAISYTINNYLSEAMSERVARDMRLAETFYDLMLDEIKGVTAALSIDPLVSEHLKKYQEGDINSQSILTEQIVNQFSRSPLEWSHITAVLDKNCNLVAGYQKTTGDQLRLLESDSNWQCLDLVRNSISSDRSLSETEIIPVELLTQVGLADQARITIIDTPRAAPKVFDSREGSAGLAMVSVSPVKDATGEIIGSVTAFHLLNNDFTLIERITKNASIDSATVFFGDLRVSTNILNAEGNRAIGTRISQEVSDVVLHNGKEYVGPAFVVDQEYITRYDPLKNHLGEVIGILYVGVKQAEFQRLINSFNQRISLVAFGMVLFTIIITTPVARAITRPLDQLKVLVDANRRIAEGDMSVRVPVRAGGDVGLLETSFNSMLDTLQATQDQLVQSEKLASVGQLAAGVAHELNNPLGTVLLYSDILLKELDPDSPYRDDIEVIVNETKRCKGIVSALLEFAREYQVVAQPTDLNALIRDVAEVEIKHYPDSQVEVIYDLDPSLPTIQADTAQMHQVLVNLIDNAIEAMLDGGELTLRTQSKPTGMISLEIADTGVGIPSENVVKVFTPFFTTKPTGKGTGLGLAIVYGIIKLHRGQISVRSEVDKGTIVTIQLPIILQDTGKATPLTSIFEES
jgi:two-component system NtrC family sensor kinase